MNIFEALQFSFLQRALLAGSFVSISCATLGVFLVLRRLSLIGHGLAHVGFAAVAVGLLLGLAPIVVSIPLVMLASLWILKLGEKTTLFADAAIGLVSTLAIATGVLLSSLAGGFNVDLFSYLFGSILAISRTEVWLSVALSLIVLVLVWLFYNDLFSITYDEDFAAVSGIKTKAINRVLIMLTALTVVLGIRVVGTLLVASLIVFPAITALQVARGFRSTIIIAAVVAVASVIGGVFLSFILNLPTGAAIVVLNFCFFIVAFIFKLTKSR